MKIGKENIKTISIIILISLLLIITGTTTSNGNNSNNIKPLIDVSEYENKINSLQSQIELLQIEQKESYDKISEYYLANNELQNKIVKLEEENTQLKTEKEELDNKIASLQTSSTSNTSNSNSKATVLKENVSNTQTTAVINNNNQTTNNTTPTSSTYIINTNTGKFHYSSCGSVSKMKESNKKPYSGSRDDLVAQGYSPCKNCNP